MDRLALLDALARLGERCPPGSEIVLAGGAALILGGFIDRATNDGDVILSRPKLSQLHALIAEVGLSEGWLNGAVVAARR